MNREAAALGVPVYSIFRGKLGAVDKYLAENGRLVIIENVHEVRSKIRLAHWERPDSPNNRYGAVLQTVVSKIRSILENQVRRINSAIPRKRRSPSISILAKLEIAVGSIVAQCEETSTEAIVKNKPALPVVHRFDPLIDSRRDIFLAKHARASLFHSSPWLKALQQTYGYSATGFTTSAPGQELESANSLLSSRKLADRPSFASHSRFPIIASRSSIDPEDLAAIVACLEEELRTKKWNYAEIRSLSESAIPFPLCLTRTHTSFHEIDLQPPLEAIFARFHKDSIQRKIRRAERETCATTRALPINYSTSFTSC